jgi:hypothetical protein
MVMVHPVNPHHFVCASSMVYGHLAEAYTKNSKPKSFEETVPTSLHAYADGMTPWHPLLSCGYPFRGGLVPGGLVL